MMDFLPGNKLRKFSRIQGFRNDLNGFKGSIERKTELKGKDAKELAKATQLTEGAAKDAIKASIDDVKAKFMAVDEIVIHIKEGSDKGEAEAKDLYNALNKDKEMAGKDNPASLANQTSLIAGRGTRFARAGRKLMSLLTKTGLKTLIFGNPITGAMAFANSMFHAVQKDQLKKEGKSTDGLDKSFIEKLEAGVDNHIVAGQKDDDVNNAREGLAEHFAQEGTNKAVNDLLIEDQAKTIGTSATVIRAIDTVEDKLKDTDNKVTHEKRMLAAQALAGNSELKTLLEANPTGDDSNLKAFLALEPEQMKQVIEAFNLAHFDGTNAARREVTDIQAKFDAVTNATSDDLADKLWAHEKAGPIRAVNMAARKGKEAVMGVAHALWKMEPKTKAIAFSVLAGITTAAAHFNPEMPKENDSSKG